MDTRRHGPDHRHSEDRDGLRGSFPASVCPCKELGRTLWRRWSGHHRRSRVETTTNCVKLIGQRLVTRGFDRLTAELQTRVAITDSLTALGISATKPVDRCQNGNGKTPSVRRLREKAGPGAFQPPRTADGVGIGIRSSPMFGRRCAEQCWLCPLDCRDRKPGRHRGHDLQRAWAEVVRAPDGHRQQGRQTPQPRCFQPRRAFSTITATQPHTALEDGRERPGAACCRKTSFPWPDPRRNEGGAIGPDMSYMDQRPIAFATATRQPQVSTPGQFSIRVPSVGRMAPRRSCGARGQSVHPTEELWRRDRDSNPGWTCIHTGFRNRPVRPLRHLSALSGGASLCKAAPRCKWGGHKCDASRNCPVASLSFSDFAVFMACGDRGSRR